MIFISRGKTKKFIGLSDVPASYTGQKTKACLVNNSENALEFKFPYFLMDADADCFLVLDHTPDNDKILAYCPAGWSFEISPSGILHIPLQSRARAYFWGAPQAIASVTLTKVWLKAESYDTQNEFDITTNYRFTAAEKGYYSITGNITYLLTVTDSIAAGYIYKNGAKIVGNITHTSGTGAIGLPLSDIVYLNAGNYLELWTWHNFGISRNLMNTSAETYFSIHKIS